MEYEKSFKYNCRLDFVYKINGYEHGMCCHGLSKGESGYLTYLKLSNDETFQWILCYWEIQCTKEANFNLYDLCGKKKRSVFESDGYL